MNSKSNMPNWGSSNNALVGVLILNLSLAATILFVRSIYFIEGAPMQDYLHQVYENLILQKNGLVEKPWTLLTHNWILVDYWSLFINMFWFFIFGYILMASGANRHIFPIYFYSGLLGGLLYLLMGDSSFLVGQEISIIAIAFACVAYAPKYALFDKALPGFNTIFIFIIYILLFVLLHLSSSISTHLIYFLTGIFGYVYILLLHKNINLGGWMHRLVQSINQAFVPKNNG